MLIESIQIEFQFQFSLMKKDALNRTVAVAKGLYNKLIRNE